MAITLYIRRCNDVRLCPCVDAIVLDEHTDVDTRQTTTFRDGKDFFFLMRNNNENII